MGEWTEDSRVAWEVETEAPERANFDPLRAPTASGDWHAQRTTEEPRCGADQWRTRDRNEITYMHEMADRHLGHCIRFASTKPQHRSRLASLLAEREKRQAAPPR